MTLSESKLWDAYIKSDKELKALYARIHERLDIQKCFNEMHERYAAIGKELTALREKMKQECNKYDDIIREIETAVNQAGGCMAIPPFYQRDYSRLIGGARERLYEICRERYANNN